jgi:Core-2/I-Branching enzyme
MRWLVCEADTTRGEAAGRVGVAVKTDLWDRSRSTVTNLAAVILAHADPAQVRRLITALDDVPIVLHCDRKTPASVFDQMTRGLLSRVTPCERLPTTLASWSLVAAELTALRQVLRHSGAKHIAVLSGADYPLCSMHQMDRDLSAWQDHTYMWSAPLPHPPWNTRRHRDGGLWRMRHRFWVRDKQVVYIRNYPLRSLVTRPIPDGLVLRASSQWKIYARRHVQLLFRVMESRPDLVRFWSSTLVPDESFVASMLGSPKLVGDDALSVCAVHPWYIDWPAGKAYHPQWLGSEHFDDLRRARYAPSVTPREAYASQHGDQQNFRKLFARKFCSRTGTEVLDRVDLELRR